MKRCDIKTFVQTFAKEIIGAFFILVGVVFVVVGLIGLFLPLIPGIICIVIGIALICKNIACDKVKRWVKVLRSWCSQSRK